MTVDDLIEWLESAKRQGGERVGDYDIVVETPDYKTDCEDLEVDHVAGMVVMEV